MSLVRFAFASFTFVLFAGCSAATEGPGNTGSGEVPGSRTSLDALKAGCHVNCPKCPPNQICPMIACVLECPPDITPCGNKVCQSGEYCCNESCGLCAPMGAMCIQEVCAPTGTCVQTALCIQGYVWDSKACACKPAKGGGKSECTSDADCRLEADYCTGCDCSALAPNEQLPHCSGPGVKCFADPCLNHTAACVSGQCTLL